MNDNDRNGATTGTSATASAAATSAAAPTDRRKSLIADTLASGFWQLRFPDLLEREFRDAYIRRSVEMLRWLIPGIFGLQLTYGAIMVVISEVPRLWFTHSWLPISGVLILMELLLLSGKVDRWVHVLVSILATVALTTTLYTMALLGDDPFVQELSWYVLLQLMVIFSLLRLRLRMVLVTSLIPAIIFFAYNRLGGLTVDWQGFSQYYGLGVLACASIAYMVEQLNRSAWLNMQQLDIEMQSLQLLRANADAETRRQQLLGEYLELTAGNLTATEIAKRTLKFLVEHTPGQVGVVYLVDDDRLRRAASWALEGDKHAADELGRGETLIGQAAENGRRMYLTHLPADYHPVRTATASIGLAALLVEPVRHQDATLAVIEIGSLQLFSDNDMNLVDRVARAMAGTLVAANARDALLRAGARTQTR